MQSGAVTVNWSVFARKTRRFQRQLWDRRGNGACKNWVERMVGRGWERFCPHDFWDKRWVCVCGWVREREREKEGVNAKQRKPGCAEISMGCCFLAALYACVVLCLCKWLSSCVHITAVTSCWVVMRLHTALFLKCWPAVAPLSISVSH